MQEIDCDWHYSRALPFFSRWHKGKMIIYKISNYVLLMMHSGPEKEVCWSSTTSKNVWCLLHMHSGLTVNMLNLTSKWPKRAQNTFPSLLSTSLFDCLIKTSTCFFKLPAGQDQAACLPGHISAQISNFYPFAYDWTCFCFFLRKWDDTC